MTSNNKLLRIMKTGRFIVVGLLAVAGISLVCWSVLGKDHHDQDRNELDSETSYLVNSSEPVLTEEVAPTETAVDEVLPSIVEADIIDKVEDEALDERFAGATANGATQAMDITENKNIEGPQKQREEAPKTEIITIVEDDSDIEEDILAPDSDQIEWVDLYDVDYIEVETESEEDVVFMVVEDAPEFPGGTEALMQFLRENVEYPVYCRENNIQGRVIVSFVVDKDGSIIEPTVEKSVHPQIDEEALRIIGLMPKWKPGYHGGKPVRVKYSVPINFRLN